MKNGDIHANTNKIIPRIKLIFLSSIIPEANNKTPIIPKIIGIICEKIVVPVIGIKSHNRFIINILYIIN